MDWGMALSVGLAVVIISEITILGAIILPKIPLEPGKTWSGTVTAVSMISVIIGGVGGYVAGQFGGRGGGGATTPGQSVVSSPPAQTPVSSQTSKVEPTRPIRPDNYLANTIDLYFFRDANTKLVANFTCELVGYQRKGSQWEMVVSTVKGKDLAEFLKLTNSALNDYQKDIPSADLSGKKLRIFRDPDPGDGVYDQLRQQTEKQGWKVERKDVAWQPEYPNT